MIRFLFRRMTRKLGLTILALLAIVLPLGVLNSIPIFSGAVDRSVLREELASFSTALDRPPFGVRMYAYGTPSTPMSLTLAEDVLETVEGMFRSHVGLPILRAQLHAYSIKFGLETPKTIDGRPPPGHPEYLHFAYYPGIEEHAETVTGTPYAGSEGTAVSGAETVEVWIRQDLADRMGVVVGDEFRCEASRPLEDASYRTDDLEPIIEEPVTARVAGTWRPGDLESDFWFGDPASLLGDSLLVSRAGYEAAIEPRQRVKVHRATWDLVLDVKSAAPDEAATYLSGLGRILRLMQQNIPSFLYDQAPIPPLEGYVARDRVLTAQLLSFSIPGLGFIAVFLGLSASIVAGGHRRDTVSLMSRGFSPSKLLLLTTIEEIVLAIAGFPLGLGLALVLARAMGHTRGFLQFSAGADYVVALNDWSAGLSLLAFCTSLGFRLLATYRQSGISIAGESQARARPPHPPFWIRYGLDLLLILPTIYLSQRLIQEGSLAAMAPLHGEELYAVPELILVPALFMATTALLCVRLFPILARTLGWIAGIVASPEILLAIRHLARRWQEYVAPLVLITLSLALGVYTLSMALSLDQWLVDRIYYEAGSDLSFSPFILQRAQIFGRGPVDLIVGGSWIPPVDDFRRIPGVRDAARVGKYRAIFNTLDGSVDGQLMAVDRAELSSVAWFRDDLSPSSLGEMLNQLADSQDAVLAPRSFMSDHLLRPGDTIAVRIILGQDMVVETKLKIVGTYDLFPTVYPENGPTLIGNLDYLSYLGGITAEHDIWAKSDGTVDGISVFESVSQMGIEAGSRKDVAALTERARSRHERVGVFGTLTLGFLTALLMAAFALIIYRQAALRDRLYWLSVLNAIGVPRSHLLRALFLEEMMLLLYSIGAALGLGILASRIFVPLMRITEGAESLLPPMIPVIAFGETQWLTIAFVGVTVLAEVGLVYRAFARSRFSELRVFG